jgi:hypothetical protein
VKPLATAIVAVLTALALATLWSLALVENNNTVSVVAPKVTKESTESKAAVAIMGGVTEKLCQS